MFVDPYMVANEPDRKDAEVTLPFELMQGDVAGIDMVSRWFIPFQLMPHSSSKGMREANHALPRSSTGYHEDPCGGLLMSILNHVVSWHYCRWTALRACTSTTTASTMQSTGIQNQNPADSCPGPESSTLSDEPCAHEIPMHRIHYQRVLICIGMWVPQGRRSGMVPLHQAGVNYG